jgi:hypothetical protein
MAVEGDDEGYDELTMEQLSILDDDTFTHASSRVDQASTTASLPDTWIPTKLYPWLPSLYDISRTDCGTKFSTEEGCRGMWQHWAAYCATRGRNVYFDSGEGLGLYVGTNAVTESTFNEQLFNRELICGFFKYLSLMSGSTPNTMTKAKTFVHAHLKCEMYVLLRSSEAHYPYISANICIGKEVQIINAIAELKRGTAERALDECLDLMGDLDDRISNMQIRSMMESVFRAEAGE